MQNSIKNIQNKKLQNPLLKDALGVTSPILYNSSLEISQKQIEILEDAIQRYERLEDIKKFSKLVFEDIDAENADFITEEDIKRALEVEKLVSIEDEKAVLALIQNEGFLNDLESADFSAFLNKNCTNDEENENYYDDLENDFSDFDLE